MTRARIAAVLLAAAAGVPAQSSLGDVVGWTKITHGTAGFEGTLGDQAEFGAAVAALPDLDGNGVADIAVGAPRAALLGTGEVWILFLEQDGSVRSQSRIGGGELLLPHGMQPPQGPRGFGSALAMLPGSALDGGCVLAVGAPDSFFAPNQTFGMLILLRLSPSGSIVDVRMVAPGFSGFTGDTTADESSHFAASVTWLGDLDGDGVQDLAVGQTEDFDPGSVWILFLNADGSVKRENRVLAGEGPVSSDGISYRTFGRAVASLGQSSGWAGHRIAVGEPGTDGLAGAVWLVDLAPDGSALAAVRKSGLDLADVPDPPILFFGTAVANVGDVDGDGHDDLAAGAPGYDGRVDLFLHGAGGDFEESVTLGPGLELAPILFDVFSDYGSAVAALDHDDGVLRLAVGDVRGQAPPIAGNPESAGAVYYQFVDVGLIPGTWEPLGNALAGFQGKPRLEGEGALVAYTKTVLRVSKAKQEAPATIVIGFDAVHAPFLGGVLVPSPDVLVPTWTTNEVGMHQESAPWPAGLPPGAALVFQAWIQDASAVQGFAASNAVRATAP